jgi:hypothetical protein
MSKIIKRLGLLWIIALLCPAVFGQNIKGMVTDSTGKPVPYATVNLKNSGNLVVDYTKTDLKGAYTFTTPEGIAITDLLVEVNFVGYKRQSKKVADLNTPVNFSLTANANILQTVNIKDSAPHLRTSGDTLSYKVSDFSNAQDRVIGDVIKKLPGVTVADDGKISYNGKSISNLYIGGDNLLDDKYNIATNTIPHGVVDDVQVIENHQPIKMLQNKVMSDDVALNLTIKKGAKLQLVGQETVGAGLPGNYDENLNAMMFKDKYKAINYIKGNNIGIDVQNDLVAHNMASYLQQLDNDKPATLLSLGTIHNPDLARNRYLFDQSGIINLNNLITLKKGVQLRANLYYLHDTQKQDFMQQTQIFLPGDTVKYTETQQNKFRPDILHGQFTLNVNKDKYYLNDALITDYSHQSSYSNLKANGAGVNQVFKDNSLDFSNELDLLQTLKTSNNILEVYSYINHISEPESRVIDPGYNAAVFNNGNPYALLAQTANVPTWFTNNYLSYKIPADYITQSYKAGFLAQSQKLQSDLNVVQLNNTIIAPDSSVNRLNWTRTKLFAEAGFDLPGKILKVNLTLPVSLQQINYTDNLYNLNKSLSRLYFNPQLKVKYQVGVEDYFSAFYNYRNNIGDIENVYRGSILTDYRTLYANNASLTETKNQAAALGYNYRKALTLFFFSINSSYNHVAANSITSSIISNSIQQGIVLPFQNNTDIWMLNGYISKYSFSLRTTFSGGVQWQNSSTNQIQNGALLPFKTIATTYNAGAETKLSDKVTVSYKANINLTNSHSNTEASAYNITQLIQQGTVNYNPTNDLYFTVACEDYLTKQKQANDLKYFFADASMRYRFTKLKTDLQLSGANLLNVKNYSTLNLAANTFTSGTFTLPGRILMLKLLFNI